jgi:hypothetical protein
MHVPLSSKLTGALLVYLLGLWAMDRAIGGMWSGLTVVGVAMVLYGVWYSSVRGRRDIGDIAFALAVALVIGQGTLLLLAQAKLIEETGPHLIGWGHLAGVMLLLIAWIPLKSQGLLPGGPEREEPESLGKDKTAP